MLLLLCIFGFLLLDLYVGDDGIGLHINNILPFGSDSESKHASDFEAFILATNDCLAQHSLVLWVELLWNSHHFLVSIFDFVVLSFPCGLGGLSWAVPPWLCPLFLCLSTPFPCFGFVDPKSRFFCLNFCSILTVYQNVVSSEEMSRNSISSCMYLSRQLWYQMFLRILDTQLHVKDMKNIGKL